MDCCRHGPLAMVTHPQNLISLDMLTKMKTNAEDLMGLCGGNKIAFVDECGLLGRVFAAFFKRTLVRTVARWGAEQPRSIGHLPGQTGWAAGPAASSSTGRASSDSAATHQAARRGWEADYVRPSTSTNHPRTSWSGHSTVAVEPAIYND